MPNSKYRLNCIENQVAAPKIRLLVFDPEVESRRDLDLRIKSECKNNEKCLVVITGVPSRIEE